MGRLSNSIGSDSMRAVDRRSGSRQVATGEPDDDVRLHLRVVELGGLTCCNFFQLQNSIYQRGGVSTVNIHFS
jgi:hypothetical protein